MEANKNIQENKNILSSLNRDIQSKYAQKDLIENERKEKSNFQQQIDSLKEAN